MLHIINGLCGYGKTYYVWNHISENIEKNEKIIVLVPEQFSFECEKIFCKLQNQHNCKNIEVLSFNRLANIIFREYGGFTKPILNDAKTNIIMSMVLLDVKDDLKIYKKQADNKCFCKNIVNIIKIFKHNNISYEDIIKYSNDINNCLLKSKLLDMALIYKKYQYRISVDYTDSSDVINKACKILKGKNFFNNYIVYIDEFDAFTKSEYNILEYIIKESKDVYLTLCLNNDDRNIDILNCVKKTKKQFIHISKENLIDIENINFLKTPYRFKNNELARVEQNILNILNGFEFKDEINWENQNNFNITECDNIRQEIEFVASEICNLIKNKNYKFRDIIVLTSNIELYKDSIEYIFNMYDIPYFSDEQKSVLNNNFIIFIITLLDVIISNFQTLNILKLLKTGFFDLSGDDIFQLEIYCNMWNINSEMWFEDFTFNPRGFTEIFTQEDKDLLLKINITRKKIVDILFILKDKFKKSDYANNFIKIFYEYLIDLDIPEKWKNISSFFEEGSLEDKVKIWDSFIGVLDDITDIVGDKKLTLKEFANLLDIAIYNIKIKSLPKMVDQVMVGVIGKTITYNPKIVFIIGCNQGIFSNYINKTSFFSESENRNLCKIGFEFIGTQIEKTLDELYYIYKSMASSTEKVYLSYCNKSIDGGQIYKSITIYYIEKFFKGIKIKKFDEKCLKLIQNYKTGYGYLCKNFNSLEKEFEIIKQFLIEEKSLKDDVDKLYKIKRKEIFCLEDNKILKTYTNNNLYLSPSSIERFYTCNFKFFCNDILKISAQKKAKLNKMQQGTIIHYILKEIVEKEIRNSFQKIDISKEVSHSLNKYLDKLGVKTFFTSKESKYISDSINKFICKIILHINKEQENSNFKIEELELEISKNSLVKPLALKLNSGEKVFVSGKVDRVDCCEINSNKYSRIIDYKSGSKEFNLNDVYYGLNMQMLVYMFILKNFEKNLKPAGVLYFPVKDSIAFTKRNKGKDINNLDDINFRMNGVLLEDIEVLGNMEKNLSGFFLPIKINKDGSVSKNSSTLKKESFDCLETYIKNKILNIADSLYSGKISSNPVCGGKYKDICSYCEYKFICNLNDDLEFRILNKPPQNWIEETNESLL